jgi:tetratricopeptide (TPR) repeat protein
MKKSAILFSLFVVIVALTVRPSFAQNTGTVKGVCKDVQGNPIVGGVVEWTSTETGRNYTLKTNNKGEYFSLGITPGKYNVKLSKDGKEMFHYNGVPVSLEETTQDFDLKKEQAAQAAGQGLTPEQVKARQDAAAKAEGEKKTVATLNEKLSAARAAETAKDYDTAISTLNEANQIDPSHEQIWFELGNSELNSTSKLTDNDEKQKRYDAAVAAFQKAIDLRTGSEQAQKDPNNNTTLAAYYNNLAQALARERKVDDAVTDYTKAAQLDPTKVGTYLYNAGAALTNAGKIDDAIAMFDKVIAADPTKADAYYQKGVNLLGKETVGKDGKAVAPAGTAEAFQKYLELAPTGQYADGAKQMLAMIGAPVETGFGKKKSK